MANFGGPRTNPTSNTWPFSDTQIAPSGKSPDPYNSKEKQIVRNKQWVPVFREIASNMSPAHIRYLCFPSPSCAFVKQLRAPNIHLLGANSFVIAVEKSPSSATEIVRKFSNLFNKGSYDIIIMGYESAIESEKLINYFAKQGRRRAGFDILELDFTDSIFSINQRGESKILDAIIKTLMLQSVFGRREKYYLISSFKMKFRFTQTLRQHFSDAASMLCENFIQRYDQNLSSELNRLPSNNLDGSRINWCILHSIPLIIIEHAPRLMRLSLTDVPYTYVSQSAGAKSRIVSFVFSCEHKRPSLSHPVEPILQEVQHAFNKVRNTIWV